MYVIFLHTIPDKYSDSSQNKTFQELFTNRWILKNKFNNLFNILHETLPLKLDIANN